MHIDQVVERLKKGSKLICSRCGQELGREHWSSEWDKQHPDDHHYKVFVCSCGKKNWLRVDFPGSGHDTLLENGLRQIESSVRKVQAK